MSNNRQVFQTSSPWRWRTFKWSGRLIVVALLIIIPVIIITLSKGIEPDLPLLSGDRDSLKQVAAQIIPAGLTKKELRRYKGFNEFFQAKEKNEKLSKQHHPPTDRIRAAFYVDWDPQSFSSLEKNIGQLNMVVPEWFFIDPTADTLKADIDLAALQLMKKHQVKIVPIINNINSKKGAGEFDGNLIHRILHDHRKKQRLISDVLKYCRLYHLDGINIDFEEFSEKSDEPIITFQKELYAALHAAGLLVTQDVMANNSDFNLKELSAYNDYVFLMAYDEHFASSVPGPVASQQWIEKVLDETAAEIPSDKIVVCIAGYGYDWQGKSEAQTVSYQQALTNAKQYHAAIQFDNNTYSNHYQYAESNGNIHQVYFNDAAGNFNTMRFADEYGTAGVALWRLGSEDERIWSFYARGLSNKNLQQNPFDFRILETVNTVVSRPEYIGDGEILNVVTEPSPGRIRIQTDQTENLIAEQEYLQLPTKYVIKKYGNVHNKVLLTFDDGPDPEYTPAILDVLAREKVPATFFVVGMQAENNIPLLNRIYREGHEIGNHTFTHPNMAAVSYDRAATEMESTRLLIEAVTGRNTVLFRAPYNADAEPSTEAELKPVALSRAKNYYTVGESIDPNDWEPGVTADSVYNRTIRQYEANPSKGIILLHDAGGDRVLMEFDRFCCKAGLRPAFYRVDEDSVKWFRELKKQKLIIGQEAILDTSLFTMEGKDRKSLRNGLNSLQKKGFSVRVHKAPQEDEFLKELRMVSDEWLTSFEKKELIFSQGMFDENELMSQDIITIQDATGAVMAFLNIIPNYAEGECTYDLIRKKSDAPGAAMDALIVRLIEYAKENNQPYINLGLVPMSGITHPENMAERILKLASVKLKRFQQYQGLREFKEKYATAWENKYLVYDNELDLIQLPAAINTVMKP